MKRLNCRHFVMGSSAFFRFDGLFIALFPSTVRLKRRGFFSRSFTTLKYALSVHN